MMQQQEKGEMCHSCHYETFNHSSFAQPCNVRTDGPIHSGMFWLHVWQEAADEACFNSTAPGTSAQEWLRTENKHLKLLFSGNRTAY